MLPINNIVTLCRTLCNISIGNIDNYWPAIACKGSEYLYSTHNWTLVSAVVEGASGKKFPQLMKELFKDLGLMNTYLDEAMPIIQNRAR